jgi:hypothetical protein
MVIPSWRRTMKFVLAGAAVLLFAVVTLPAHAQKNELAAEGSGLIDVSAYNPSFGAGFQINYARRLFHVPLVSLYGELPFVAGFHNEQFVVSQLQREFYNNYYLTPGVRVKFAPEFPISPYLAIGAGWAHFASTQTSASDDEFAADWGGGFDIKLIPFVGLRFEARDFYGTVPTLIPGVPSNGNHNNVAASGGVVLRF